MTALALIDRSPPSRAPAIADEAPIAACGAGRLEHEKWLDQTPRPCAREDVRAFGDGRGVGALAVTAGESRRLLGSTGLRGQRAGVGEIGYWIRTEGLE
jgi:RimJ/RimL family protein N-acetyltransferase